ncbi:putative filamentation protein [Talaromyces proteolyticus]|uniref:Filamentation protein n=1 Tax=Talaromyces proteolyticus TaxID=1131652 RepID=A0AAD4PZE6_9EURO|nr:putative filamentation protein [Talaromyces proteolyticus]KAH8702530.1 putative filamentation protein [Talaromyces proteolyticus]
MSENSVREADKAQGYIDALDNARSEDKWGEIPELIRKVSKHAPNRKCLIQTASAEIQVVAYISKTRPGTAKGQPVPNQVSNLSELIPLLISAIEEGEGTPQDIFQARVCLGWIHWTLSEPGLAVGRLPNDFEESTILGLAEEKKKVTKWSEICIVKGGYIKCAAQSVVSGPDDALKTASSILPRLATPNPGLASCPQALYWSEKFLSRTALLASEQVGGSDAYDCDFEIELALKAFRLWSGHPYVKRRDITAGHAINQSPGSSESGSPFSMWMSYYRLLSTILQHGMQYFPPSRGSPHNQLADELRRVETVCESALLREIRFPTASSSNPQVEVWVEEVIHNWEVLCGPGWRNDDFGESVQDAISRNVLDILYRAATKTYHSHLILKRLFHVHAALAEFELATKALDTYIEIVINAKTRAEKAAEIGELESDGNLLQTVSEGVLLLCCFGAEEEARKAKDLIVILQKYVRKAIATDLNTAYSDREATSWVSPKVIALAYRAIGIGLGNWSRWTPVNESRDDIRAEAIENLERSIAPEFEAQDDISTRYALALLLAESRDLDNAILHVRSALSTRSRRTQSTNISVGFDGTPLSQEQDSVPLWHLLALLLSAKQEFDIASRSCEAAFDQLPSTLSVFAHDSKRSHNNSHKERPGSLEVKQRILKHLRGREKERIIETQMTQVALIEVVDGPEVAVNHTDHLLTMFTSLFEDLELEVTPEKVDVAQQRLGPPKSSSGTVKSFRGSIFGRKKGTKAAERTNGAEDIPPLPGQESLPTTDGDAPSTQVTDEAFTGSTSARPDEHPKPHRHYANQDLKTNGSDRATNNIQSTPQREDVGNGYVAPTSDNIGIAISDAPVQPSSATQSAKQTLPAVAHNLEHQQEPPPGGHPKQPPEQDVRLPVPQRFESPVRALTRFPTAQAQKHALSILAKVWLLIAGLYRRASLFDDAREACEEAIKQVEKFEALVAAQDSSAKSFSERVWGISKSSEELWGDVYAEQGALCQAQSSPHEAMEFYEEAVARVPNHPRATIGLSSLLLDIWDEKIPAQPLRPTLDHGTSTLASARTTTQPTTRNGSKRTNADTVESVIENIYSERPPSAVKKDERVRHMNRLAARDRAYGLLSMLTKTGSSWDNSEAWFTLSRAYEAGSQIEKTKDVLWWCVELEDRKPIRHWWNVGSGSYVL